MMWGSENEGEKRWRGKGTPFQIYSPCQVSTLFFSSAHLSLLFKSRPSGGLKGDCEPLMQGNKRVTLFCREPFMSLKLTRCRKRKPEMESVQREGWGSRRKAGMRGGSSARLVVRRLDVVATSRLKSSDNFSWDFKWVSWDSRSSFICIQFHHLQFVCFDMVTVRNSQNL